MKQILRSTYLENHAGSSYKFYQPVAWRDDAGVYHVDAAYGRIGAGGQVAPKYQGTDPAAALAAFNRLVDEKLRGGYSEADALRGRDDFLVERGAEAWDLEPRLLPLRTVRCFGPDDTTPAGYRYEGFDEAPQRRLAVLADTDGLVSRAYDLDRAEAVLLRGPLFDLAIAAQEAGYAPFIFETAVGRGRTTLLDVWELGGLDLSGIPGSERILLREQIAALHPTREIAVPTTLGASTVELPCLGIDLQSGERAWVRASGA